MGKERIYRVLVIAISLRGNKIANFNDEISESQLSAPIADLVSGGYIEEVTEETKKPEENKANSSKTDGSGKKSEATNLGDIANSVPGAKVDTDKK